MMDVLKWCMDHYEIVIAILSFCVSLVLFIVRKKPIVVKDTIKSFICTWLPAFICKAEDTGLKGQAKLEYVLNGIREFVFKEDTESFKIYEKFVRSQIEAILSTPQKK